MAFDEIRLPDEISLGSAGGPGFKTTVLFTDSGVEERSARWATSRRQYNVILGVRKFDDMTAFQNFWIARQGSLKGFRFKDFSDFTTASNHRTAPSDTDEVLGAGDGSQTQFQLLKTYVSGPVTRTRNLTKPVAGTTVISLNAVPQSSGFTVDTTTGIVTFTVAPGGGVAVGAGCEFDVPVRFGQELEDEFNLSIDGFDIVSLDRVPLIEIRDELNLDEEFFFGGAQDLTMSAGDFQLALGLGRVVNGRTDVADRKLILPAKTNLPPGGPYFMIKNGSAGAFQFQVRDGVDATDVVTLTQFDVTVIYLSVDSGGLKSWVAIGP